LARTPIVIPARTAPKQYGKPFIVLEDAQKRTFIYKSGAWVPHDRTIAQCRMDCEVKELPQKVNQMTRYEVRCPIGE
jgi:hypothetical protein